MSPMSPSTSPAPALALPSRLFAARAARLRVNHPAYFARFDSVDPYCATAPELAALIADAPTEYWRGLLTAQLLARLQMPEVPIESRP